MPGLSLSERFERYVFPEPNTGCWLWGGCLNSMNYGLLRVGKTMKLAHRISYELHCAPVLDTLKVLHKCDFPPCVNPEHLFVGTMADNTADMVRKNRCSRLGMSMPSESNAAAKLTVQKVIEIRDAAGTQYEIALRFGVAQGTVSNIRRRKTWRHLP